MANVDFPSELFVELIEEKLPSVIRSAYCCVERRGKVYHLFDAERIPLGKMCVRIAGLIQGKHKPIYRHDRAGVGDVCVIVNAEKMKLTGKKAFQKTVRYHTGYIGHLREIPYKRMIQEKPEQLIFRNVSKILPKNNLRPKYLELLKVYRGPKHPLTNYLPNFGHIHVSYDHLVKLVEGDFTPENSVVTFESEGPGPIEYKDFEREIDRSFEIPFPDRHTRIPDSPANQNIDKEYKAFLKKLRRYKEYKLKPPKNRDIIELAKHDSVMINRDWQYRRLKLDDLEGPDEIDDD